MAPEQLDPIIVTLLRENYTGVLTLEVFGEADFQSSGIALEQCIEDSTTKAH